MARLSKRFLDTGDRFPELDLQLISGRTLRLPQELEEGYSVIFLYRGHW